MPDKESMNSYQWREYLDELSVRGSDPYAQLTMDEWRDLSIERLRALTQNSLSKEPAASKADSFIVNGIDIPF